MDEYCEPGRDRQLLNGRHSPGTQLRDTGGFSRFAMPWPGWSHTVITVLVERAWSAVIVDDDADIRALIAELLRQSGFEVTEAASGTDGIAAVREVQPDVVTLDLNLPDLDGIEVCRRIREITDAYVVMLTARPDEIDRLMGLEIGADDYLTKPFSPRELRARIAAMLRRPRSGPAALPAAASRSTSRAGW
jgi:DNA-binding response OmpR family regulator